MAANGGSWTGYYQGMCTWRAHSSGVLVGSGSTSSVGRAVAAQNFSVSSCTSLCPTAGNFVFMSPVATGNASATSSTSATATAGTSSGSVTATTTAAVAEVFTNATAINCFCINAGDATWAWDRNHTAGGPDNLCAAVRCGDGNLCGGRDTFGLQHAVYLVAAVPVAAAAAGAGGSGGGGVNADPGTIAAVTIAAILAAALIVIGAVWAMRRRPSEQHGDKLEEAGAAAVTAAGAADDVDEAEGGKRELPAPPVVVRDAQNSRGNGKGSDRGGGGDSAGGRRNEANQGSRGPVGGGRPSNSNRSRGGNNGGGSSSSSSAKPPALVRLETPPPFSPMSPLSAALSIFMAPVVPPRDAATPSPRPAARALVSGGGPTSRRQAEPRRGGAAVAAAGGGAGVGGSGYAARGASLRVAAAPASPWKGKGRAVPVEAGAGSPAVLPPADEVRPGEGTEERSSLLYADIRRILAGRRPASMVPSPAVRD
ncbi:hypothetical protein HK405_007074 [Cladochytrium tenue]|nr:hypothetical protein HK405_007074 [Cladochytrium tenue]